MGSVVGVTVRSGVDVVVGVGVAVGVVVSNPVVLGADDSGVDVAGVVSSGITGRANGAVFSVSRVPGVGVFVVLTSGVTEPSAGAGVVALPTGTATTTVSPWVAPSSLGVVGNGVGVSVSSPPVPCVSVITGVALTVAVITGACARVVVEVTVKESVSIDSVVFGGLPGATPKLPGPRATKTITRQRTITNAPAVAMEGVRRREPRNHSSQPTRTSGRVRATEWGTGRCGARS